MSSVACENSSMCWSVARMSDWRPTSASLLTFALINRYLGALRGALLCMYATWLLTLRSVAWRGCSVEALCRRCFAAASSLLRHRPWLGCGGGSREMELMAESAAPSPGRIFISYRREETAYPAGWLYDRLADRYGGGQVFKDVDSIQLGDDFVEVITRAVGSCDVLLALIGDRWLTITDQDGRRRLDDPDDFVRLEIEAALTRNVRVIPILVDGAQDAACR